MIEFIVRKSAEKFYRQLKEIELDCEVLFISGFDYLKHKMLYNE